MSRIAIVGGTGAEGAGLGFRWAAAGESVILGSRDAGRARRRAKELRAKLDDAARLEGADNATAVSGAEVVVLTVPFPAQADTLKQLKNSLRPGQILIDATVPLAASVGGRATRTLGVWQGSAAQQAAELVPKGVPVAAAFHHIGAELLLENAPLDCDVLVCSDDPAATAIAIDLAQKIPGIRGIDAGRLENARILEQISALLIAINIKHKVHSSGLRITGLPTTV